MYQTPGQICVFPDDSNAYSRRLHKRDLARICSEGQKTDGQDTYPSL